MQNNARAVIQELGYEIESDNATDLLEYDRWYKGYDTSFHDFKMFSNGKSKKCRRKQLFLGKKVCEEHASLLNFDKRTVAIDDEVAGKFITTLFESRDFYFRINQFLEKTVAYGYGLIIVLKDQEGKTNWVMLDPLQFYTIQRDIYGNTTGIAVPFEKFLYIETFNEGKVTIRIIPADENGSYLMDEMKTDTISRPHPLFTIFENPLANSDNTKGYSPSVLAGAIDYMKMLDLVVTSLSDEFALGKKRIIVSESALQEKMNFFSTDPESKIQYFDTEDTIFQFLPDTSFGDDEPLIKEIDMKLRVGEHKIAINMLLNLLSFQTSLGSNYFSFTDSGDNLTTATQVISNKSETYRNLKKFETNLESRLRKFIQSVLFVSGYTKNDVGISIKFDDSIIKDDSKLREVAMNEVRDKVISKQWYHINILNLTEKESEEIIEQLGNESLLIDSKESSTNMVGGVPIKTTINKDVEDEKRTNSGNN